jgi:hypothetical protein
MTRTLSLVSLLVVLAVGGYLYASQAQTTVPAAQQAETQADAAAAATSFDTALPELQAWFADHGTYAGVTLAPVYNIVVVRADATSYCQQSGDRHLAGPNGIAAPGPC